MASQKDRDAAFRLRVLASVMDNAALGDEGVQVWIAEIRDVAESLDPDKRRAQ